VRADALERMAGVLEGMGELEEALRIRRDEVLPVYRALGDARACALTMSSIAEIMKYWGQRGAALAMWREEILPVFKALGDARLIAVASGKVADLLQLTGDHDEAIRIRVTDQIPIYEVLEDLHGLVVARANLAINLIARSADGDRDEARQILEISYAAAAALGLDEAPALERIMARHGWG
jgi:hypothetical protein